VRELAVEVTAARLRRHWGLLVVLAMGGGLRILVEVAYWPALYYPDSGAYIAAANGSLFSDPVQPGGYPLVIRVLRLVGLHYGALTSLQHVAGLLTGLVVYMVTLRWSGRTSIACIGAALVVLDGYAIAVEQYVMTEALFGVMLMAAAAFSLLPRRRELHLLGGVVLALACLVRPVGLVCIPVWLGYMLWRYRPSYTLVLCCAAVLLPIVGYAAENNAHTGHFGLSDDTAWLLYARVAPFGGCQGLALPADQRVLCPGRGQVGHSAAYYMYSVDSPAVRAFGLPAVKAPPRVNHLLRGYALHVISHRPLKYVGAVGGDFGAFFVPRAPSDLPLADRPITLAAPGVPLAPGRYPPRALSDALRTYASIVHTVRPLLALFLIAGVAALVLGSAEVRAAIALLEGMGVALMFGAALSHFELRYALPAVPLIVSGGLIAMTVVWRAISARRSSSPASVAPR
jgi:hypothetical protein